MKTTKEKWILLCASILILALNGCSVESKTDVNSGRDRFSNIPSETASGGNGTLSVDDPQYNTDISSVGSDSEAPEHSVGSESSYKDSVGSKNPFEDSTDSEDSSGNSVSEQDPTEQAPTEQDPTEQDPTEQDSTEQDPTEQDPTEQDPTEQDPTEQDPTEEDPTEQDPTEEDPTDISGPKIGERVSICAEDLGTVAAGGILSDNSLFECISEDSLTFLEFGMTVSVGNSNNGGQYTAAFSSGLRQNTQTTKGIESPKFSFRAKVKIELIVYFAYSGESYSNDFSRGVYSYVTEEKEETVAMAESRNYCTAIAVTLDAGETIGFSASYERSRGGYLWFLGACAGEICE